MVRNDYTKKWGEAGVKAGETEGWMNLEETLKEDLDMHPTTNFVELVQNGIDGWQGTDHFQGLYGQKMADDARDPDTYELDTDKYLDYREEFWEGYLEGRANKGIRIYNLAKKLIAARIKSKSVKKSYSASSKSRKSSRKANSSLGSVR
jgi:hypothetical protein